jgi:hypothetical protein
MSDASQDTPKTATSPSRGMKSGVAMRQRKSERASKRIALHVSRQLKDWCSRFCAVEAVSRERSACASTPNVSSREARHRPAFHASEISSQIDLLTLVPTRYDQQND